MQNEISMETVICQAENGFSFGELVIKLSEAYEKNALTEILKMNLKLTREVLIYWILDKRNMQRCCSDRHLTLNGSFEHRIRTSLGTFQWNLSDYRSLPHRSNGVFQILFHKIKIVPFESYHTSNGTDFFFTLMHKDLFVRLNALNTFFSCAFTFSIDKKHYILFF